MLIVSQPIERVLRLGTMEDQRSSSVYLRTLKLEKEIFWAENRHCSPEQIQQLWTIRNKEVERELLSFLAPTDPIQDNHRTAENLMRPSSQPLTAPPPAYPAMTTSGSVCQPILTGHGPNRLTLVESSRDPFGDLIRECFGRTGSNVTKTFQ